MRLRRRRNGSRNDASVFTVSALALNVAAFHSRTGFLWKNGTRPQRIRTSSTPSSNLRNTTAWSVGRTSFWGARLGAAAPGPKRTGHRLREVGRAAGRERGGQSGYDTWGA